MTNSKEEFNLRVQQVDIVSRRKGKPMAPNLYREDKATQAAALLLGLRGQAMSYLKLLKLMYLADRAALLEFGSPITFDDYVCMDNGPVLSRTYSAITVEPDPRHPSYWSTYISAPKNYEVELLGKVAPSDQLSQAEEEILKSVFAQYGQLSRWELVDVTHRLPEWRDPEGSTLPIEYRQILQAEGWADDEIRDLVDAIEAHASAREMLG